MQGIAVSFIGHREVENKAELKTKLMGLIESLIIDKKAENFVFGSRSDFDEICYQAVTELKEKYPKIRRIYIRGEYPYINEDYTNYLLKSYEETYFPEKALKAGKAVYIIRNREMIDKSDICVFYYNIHTQGKGGTKSAFNYALKRKVIIINVFDASRT